MGERVCRLPRVSSVGAVADLGGGLSSRRLVTLQHSGSRMVRSDDACGDGVPVSDLGVVYILHDRADRLPVGLANRRLRNGSRSHDGGTSCDDARFSIVLWGNRTAASYCQCSRRPGSERSRHADARRLSGCIASIGRIWSRWSTL